MTLRWPALAAGLALALMGASGCTEARPQTCAQGLGESRQPLAKAPRNGAQYGGMAIDAGGISDGSGAPKAAADSGYGLLRIYVVLSAPGAGMTDAQRSALTSTLSEIKNTGVLQAFVRFYYQDALTSKANAADTAGKIRSDIESAKATLLPFVDIMPFIQAGFLGPWGEWWGGDLEGSDFGSDQALRTLKTSVVDSLKSAFPNTFIQLRYPRDIATYYEGDSQIAFHNDSVLAGSDDGGTFSATKKCALWPDGDPGKQRAWIKQRTSKLGSFNAGESSENTPDVSCSALLAYLQEYGITVFNAQWPSVVKKCADQIKSLRYAGPLGPSGSVGGGGSSGLGGSSAGPEPGFGTELGCWATDQRPWQLCNPAACETDRCRRAAADKECTMYRGSACKGSWPPAGYAGEETVSSGSGGASGKGGNSSVGGSPGSSAGGAQAGANNAGGNSSAAGGAVNNAGAAQIGGGPTTPGVTEAGSAAQDGGCE